MSFLSTNLLSFYVSMPKPSSPEIQRNNYDNLIPDNAGNSKTTESKTAKSGLKYWQEHDGVNSDDTSEFNQRYSEIFPVSDKLIPGSLGDGKVVQEDGKIARYICLEASSIDMPLQRI